MSVATFRPVRDPREWQLRTELAAVFRLAVLNDWHEAVANHISVATSEDGSRFLINPRWMHFSRIQASDLLHLDSHDATVPEGPDAPDPSAWFIHGRIHALLPRARCILHLHPPYGTALATLANPQILPIDQNTARYFRRVAIDQAYGGIADHQAEGERLARALGDKRRLIMSNHGILIVAPTVAEAFDDFYYLERACRTLVLAYGSGQTLAVLPDDVAEATARGWEAYSDAAEVHFAEARRLLDKAGENYAD